MSRFARPTGTLFASAVRPSSNFDFVEEHFAGSPPIRRLFSLARSPARNFQSVVVEDVPAEGAVADEVEELKRLFPDYTLRGLKRVSFWKNAIADQAALTSAPAEDCLGWAILKHDKATIREEVVDEWHVFESVMVKYGHHHNYIPGAPSIPAQIGERAAPVALRGWLYCQQNRLNKCCSQVALRTLATTFLGDFNLSYSRINGLVTAAPKPPEADWLPCDGLRPAQIEAVLEGLEIPYDSIYYPQRPEGEEARLRLPYQKYLYSGAESGTGALLAFRLDGPRAGGGAHIIPVFGHTFNEDTWAPRSEGAYFKLGEKIRYIPSHAWMSSFLIHDDNFGSDLCLPKRYVRRRYADYVVALRPRGFAYGGVIAEVIASQFFYSSRPKLIGTGNRWLDRLLESVQQQELILRTVPITKAGYVEHLRAQQDWKWNAEINEVVDDIAKLLHEKMWMVEVSVPELFSTNLRKLGELLLCAERPISSELTYDHFVLARFPGRYLIFNGLDAQHNPQFAIARSALESHTELLIRK